MREIGRNVLTLASQDVILDAAKTWHCSFAQHQHGEFMFLALFTLSMHIGALVADAA
jgi:hypothetical protein